MSREILKPEYGEPLIFKLGPAPSLVEGRYGHQWRYFVNNDEALLYLDAPAKEAIDATGAGKGAEICLRKSKLGRATQWEAERIEEEPVMVETFPGEAQWMQPHQRAHLERMNSRREAMKAQPAQGKVNGNGNGHHAPPAAPSPPPAPVKEMPPHRPGAKLYAMALFAAIDAAKLGQDYAQSQGMKLEFTSEDVRSMAATLYIDQRKEAK